MGQGRDVQQLGQHTRAMRNSEGAIRMSTLQAPMSWWCFNCMFFMSDLLHHVLWQYTVVWYTAVESEGGA